MKPLRNSELLLLKTSSALIKVVFLLCFLDAATAQDQTIINGDDGLKIILNTTSRFGAQFLRELHSPTTTQNPASSTTPGLPKSTTAAAASQTTESKTAISSKTGIVDVAVVGLKEIDDTWKVITADNHSLSRDELMARGYFVKQPANYQASLNPDNSAQAICSQFVANPVKDAAPVGALNVTICVVKSNGTITKSGSGAAGASVAESMQVATGQVWASIQVSNWPWCSFCTKDGERNVSGAYLNIEVEVMVNKQLAIKPTDAGVGKPVRYIIGQDATMDVSKLVMLDGQGSMIVMPNNYPTLQLTEGNYKATITVSLPRFTTSATFYQVIDPGHQPAPKEGSEVVGGATKTSTVSSLLIVCLAALAMLRAA